MAVTVIQEDPYVMLRSNESNLIYAGNARFSGFCIDLLKEIAKLLKFDYVIKLVDDGKYGAPGGLNGEWNGMVGELTDKVIVEDWTDKTYVLQLRRRNSFIIIRLSL